MLRINYTTARKRFYNSSNNIQKTIIIHRELRLLSLWSHKSDDWAITYIGLISNTCHLRFKLTDQSTSDIRTSKPIKQAHLSD